MEIKLLLPWTLEGVAELDVRVDIEYVDGQCSSRLYMYRQNQGSDPRLCNFQTD